MSLGVITRLSEKRFGFIQADDGNESIFFHHSVLDGLYWGALDRGTRVEFEAEDSEKGLRATWVGPADSGPACS